MRSRQVRAVITVEAAVVMGVVLLGLSLLLRMSLYLHDKAVLSGMALESAQAARERDRAEEGGESLRTLRSYEKQTLLAGSGAGCAAGAAFCRFRNGGKPAGMQGRTDRRVLVYRAC